MFVNNIKPIRAKNGKTQVEMAKYLNITQAAYSKIERRANPPIDVVFLLSEYFKIPVTQIYSKK